MKVRLALQQYSARLRALRNGYELSEPCQGWPAKRLHGCSGGVRQLVLSVSPKARLERIAARLFPENDV